MSRYMLDTNILSDLIRNPQGKAAKRIARAEDEICLSIIAAAELRYGCAKGGAARHLKAWRTSSLKSSCCLSMFLPTRITAPFAPTWNRPEK